MWIKEENINIQGKDGIKYLHTGSILKWTIFIFLFYLSMPSFQEAEPRLGTLQLLRKPFHYYYYLNKNQRVFKMITFVEESRKVTYWLHNFLFQNFPMLYFSFIHAHFTIDFHFEQRMVCPSADCYAGCRYTWLYLVLSICNHVLKLDLMP